MQYKNVRQHGLEFDELLNITFITGVAYKHTL